MVEEVDLDDIHSGHQYPGYEDISFSYPKTATQLFYRDADDKDPLWGWQARKQAAITSGYEPWDTC